MGKILINLRSVSLVSFEIDCFLVCYKDLQGVIIGAGITVNKVVQIWLANPINAYKCERLYNTKPRVSEGFPSTNGVVD